MKNLSDIICTYICKKQPDSLSTCSNMYFYMAVIISNNKINNNKKLCHNIG